MRLSEKSLPSPRPPPPPPPRRCLCLALMTFVVRMMTGFGCGARRERTSAVERLFLLRCFARAMGWASFVGSLDPLWTLHPSSSARVRPFGLPRARKEPQPAEQERELGRGVLAAEE